MGPAMFGLSFGEIVIIAIVALLLLGPDRLPEAAKTLGKGLREIRRATDDLKDQVEQEIYSDGKKPARRALVPPVPALPVPGPAGPPPPASAENVPGLEAALAEPAPAPPGDGAPRGRRASLWGRGGRAAHADGRAAGDRPRERVRAAPRHADREDGPRRRGARRVTGRRWRPGPRTEAPVGLCWARKWRRAQPRGRTKGTCRQAYPLVLAGPECVVLRQPDDRPAGWL